MAKTKVVLHLHRLVSGTSVWLARTRAASSPLGIDEQWLEFRRRSRIHFDFRGVGGLGLRKVA